MFDYAKLRALTVERGKTGADVAVAAGMAPATYSCKLNGRNDFTQSEIAAIVGFLNINPADIALYFFAEKV